MRLHIGCVDNTAIITELSKAALDTVVADLDDEYSESKVRALNDVDVGRAVHEEASFEIRLDARIYNAKSRFP